MRTESARWIEQLYEEGWLVKTLDASGRPLMFDGRQSYTYIDNTTSTLLDEALERYRKAKLDGKKDNTRPGVTVNGRPLTAAPSFHARANVRPVPQSPDVPACVNDKQRRRLYAVRKQLELALRRYRNSRSAKNRQKLRDAVFAYRYFRLYPLAPMNVRLPGRPRRKGPKLRRARTALDKIQRPKRARQSVYKSTAIHGRKVSGGLPSLGKRR